MPLVPARLVVEALNMTLEVTASPRTLTIRESLDDYVTCTAHLPPSQRWRRNVVVCGAMVATKDRTAPICCPACGSRVV